MVLGTFEDDYSSRHVVTATEWRHGRAATYHIVEWHPAEQFLVAQNDQANPSDPGKWTRIDWMPLPPSGNNDQTFTWAFCMSAYNASSREIARSTDVAKRATPRTGCNGFPFTRMKRGKEL